MDKYIGRLLDNRYEILEVIGTGGMAVVYKARCHRLNRLVAIKILKDDYLEDEEFRRRFHSESQAVAMLSHPNIVSVYDVSTSITADYIVMELIDGITLKQYMEKKGVLNWKETLHFGIQIAKALEHAHSRGIVHRDIKPHNVMVLKNGSVKVTDFGIARMMSKGNTLTKEALGSVHYISPEQAKGGRVDNRSDIYSLGVVMYEMMSGRPPYDGESPVAVAIQHINGGAVMPSTLNPNIPGGLEQIIMKAMGHEPDARYTTASQMLTDLDEFRKHPDILFDYNTPPIDDVTRIVRPPLVLEPQTPQPTAAERAAERAEQRMAQRRAAGSSAQRPVQSRTRREREEERRSNVATIAIIACSVVMVVAVLIFFAVYFWDQADLVKVPNLVGQTYDELPAYADFNIKLSGEVYDDEVEAGKIIKQTPLAGEEIAKNESIYVTVSLGTAPDEDMPYVVGWELSEAERALNNLKLNLQIIVREVNSNTVDAGKIIRTNPSEGAQLKTGQEVVLYVSLGKEIKTSTMPQVVTYEKEHAKSVLDDQGLDLQIQFEEVFDSKIEKGKVVKTVPEAGATLKTGQMVTLHISKGPEIKAIPDILERNIADAVSMLYTAGFSNYITESVESTEEKETVVELKIGDRTVQPGEQVDVTTQIILVVSKGPEVTKTVIITVPSQQELAEMGIAESLYTDEAGNVAIILTLRQADTVYYETSKDAPLNFDSPSVNVNVKGSGIQVYELLVNGERFSKIEVNFKT